MLENIPKAAGEAMQSVRAGAGKLTINAISAPLTITVESEDFDNAQPIPPRFTSDGAGVSPQLKWHGAPKDTACVALMIEDPDAPAPEPLVHAIAPLLPAEGELAAGALNDGEVDTGRNSYLGVGYLPPDPPTGHGQHRYAFEVFALSEEPHDIEGMGRGELVAWMRPRVLAKGCLVGTYERR